MGITTAACQNVNSQSNPEGRGIFTCCTRWFLEAHVAESCNRDSSGLLTDKLMREEARPASSSLSIIFISLSCFMLEPLKKNKTHQRYKSSVSFDLKCKIKILNKKSDVPRGYSINAMFGESMRNKETNPNLTSLCMFLWYFQHLCDINTVEHSCSLC